MNPEIKQLWIAALRSGEYLQGSGALCQFYPGISLGAYCCLGVLSDLAVKARIIDPPTPIGNLYEYGPSENTGVLPYKVARWAGIDETGMLPRQVDGYCTLTNLNDMGGYTFEQIADVIEEHF